MQYQAFSTWRHRPRGGGYVLEWFGHSGGNGLGGKGRCYRSSRFACSRTRWRNSLFGLLLLGRCRSCRGRCRRGGEILVGMRQILSCCCFGGSWLRTGEQEDWDGKDPDHHAEAEATDFVDDAHSDDAVGLRWIRWTSEKRCDRGLVSR